MDAIFQRVRNEPPHFSSGALQELKDQTFVHNLSTTINIERKMLLDAGQLFQRFYYVLGDQGVEAIEDRFDDGSVCEFVRLSNKGKDFFILTFLGSYDMILKQSAGLLFRNRSENMGHYWLPISPVARSYDKFGRILKEQVLSLMELIVLKDNVQALYKMPEGLASIDIVVWRLPLHSVLFEQLASLSFPEHQSIFLWGSHTCYSGLKDIYNHLIHGALYENRWSWPQAKWKTYGEIDGHALYVTLHSLWKATEKQIYQYIKTQIVFSVVARQDDSGAWFQGLYTDSFEEHYRYQCSGINMLASAYEETQNLVIGTSLQKATDYLRAQSEELTVGTWYLHDSLERSVDDMAESPFKTTESRAFGKSTSNMLVLNTHLDALVTLRRSEEVCGQGYQGNEVVSGVNAVIAILSQKPAESLYRLLFRAIELTFLPNSMATKLPLLLRAMRRLARLKFIPLMIRIKNLFPRLLMPNGYVDRDLSINHFEHVYHAINLMDLLRLQRRFWLDLKMIDEIIDRAIAFTQRVGLLERWLEDKSTKYALGFWVEAMYLDCLRRPERSRVALAEGVAALWASRQGLPPSLLGCNAEYIPLSNQVNFLRIQNDQILLVNLSTGLDHLEFLLVNATNIPQKTAIFPLYNTWEVLDQDDKSIPVEGILTVPPQDWVRLLSSSKKTG